MRVQLRDLLCINLTNESHRFTISLTHMLSGGILMLQVVILRIMQGTFFVMPLISYMRTQEILSALTISIFGILLTQQIYKFIKQK